MSQKLGFSDSMLDSLEFTYRAEETFYDIVDLDEFKDKNVETIFNTLLKSIRLIPFGDYLKRYIYKKTNMTVPFDDVPIKEYQYIIIDSFGENRTPRSFGETKTKWSAVTQNWLTQGTVNRAVVFLLGFGLNMCVEDVSDFLTKALRERDFNFKDHTEIIYWYCFKKGYKFHKMQEFISIYEQELKPCGDIFNSIDMTIGVRDTVQTIHDDDSLFSYLSCHKNATSSCKFSVSAWKCFSELYNKCKALIVKYYNTDGQKKTIDDITAADVEKVLCSGTPFNKSGNLEKLATSKLGKFFTGKRFSRQHIAKVLDKKTAVDRFDLITLNFFLFAHNENFSEPKKRSYAFVEDTNKLLSECMMGEYYLVNPYECFLLMCILTESPLDTYADVWELSFDTI